MSKARPTAAVDMRTSKPNRRLDLRGETCPTTTDETFRVLETMAAGQILEITSDYYPAKSTIPFLCDKRGFHYTFIDEQQPVWHVRIQKT